MAADFGLFCNPESRRVEGFAIALGRVLRQRPKLVPWQYILERRDWEEMFEETPRFLRIESPGRNWRVEQLLLLQGAGVPDAEEAYGWRRMTADAVALLSNDPGRVLPMRQWFLGWERVLQELYAPATRRDYTRCWLCPPLDIIRMFDKCACQSLLEAAGIAVPPGLGVPRSFDELWESMKRSGRQRIFLKPAHGSSASGVVAIEASRTNIQAFSTLNLVDSPDGLRLYNHRRIHTYRGAGEVRRLVDAICPERCLAQVWIPKAGLSGKPFDLRVVVIGGRARHVMLRLGRGPITNSQLLGGKGDVEELRTRMGDEAWHRMLAACESAMASCFPACLYAGFDVLVEPDFHTTHILEVNAFGDLLPRTLHEGRDTYEWEVAETIRRERTQVSAMGA
jgi:hypothetical protein